LLNAVYSNRDLHVRRPGFQSLNGNLLGTEAGHKNHRRSASLDFDLFHQFQSVDPGHLQVRNDQIRFFASNCLNGPSTVVNAQ
jgi:hypothetical protein